MFRSFKLNMVIQLTVSIHCRLLETKNKTKHARLNMLCYVNLRVHLDIISFYDVCVYGGRNYIAYIIAVETVSKNSLDEIY